ncbi:MAG: threonine ammonia-lyase [Blastocatellia bacterium]
MDSIVTLDQVRAAAEAIRPFIHETPLLPARELSDLIGARVYLKAESLQVTGSFKIRAALNETLTLPSIESKGEIKGVVAASSGNFAQALAWAGSRLNIPVTVVMERRSSPLKVARAREYGAEVVFCENNLPSRDQTVEMLIKERGLVELHSYNRLEAIAGNGSLGLELLDQLPEIDVVLAPTSGGGLLSGVAVAIKESRPSVKIIGVQPETSNAIALSLQQGKIVRLEAPQTIADGLRTGPKEITFAHIRKYVDEVALVSEDAIRRAVIFLFEHSRLVVEPSGAVAAAALLDGQLPVSGKNVVAVLSGGNISLDALQEMRRDLNTLLDNLETDGGFDELIA